VPDSAFKGVPLFLFLDGVYFITSLIYGVRIVSIANLVLPVVRTLINVDMVLLIEHHAMKAEWGVEI